MRTRRIGNRGHAALALTLFAAAACGEIADPELPTSRATLVETQLPSTLSRTLVADLIRGRIDARTRFRDTQPADPPGATATPTPLRPLWVTAYYAAWNEATLPITDVDLGAVTVLAHFAWHPTSAGGVDTNAVGNSAGQSSRVTSAVHAAGKKVVITVGGANSATAWRAAITPAKRAGFVTALVQAMNTYGYDGIDIDIEPLAASDAADVVPFVQALRTAMGPGKLLTAATGWVPEVWGPVATQLDQVNLMTYDLAGPWSGWQTWHNSALHSNGMMFPSTTRLMPSCQSKIDEALAAGASAARLGIGIDFYGYVWSGATAPNQGISGVTVTANVPYSTLMDTYYSPAARRWHPGVEAPYLSLANQFVSYDDEESIAKKVQYARDAGLGGVIVWELAGGYRKNQPVGQRDVLLQALKHAAFP